MEEGKATCCELKSAMQQISEGFDINDVLEAHMCAINLVLADACTNEEDVFDMAMFVEGVNSVMVNISSNAKFLLRQMQAESER